MPELPEVEIIRQGLSPLVTGARIKNLVLRRPNLRFDFPARFADKVKDTRIENVARRAKYLLFELSSGQTILSHLGMTGNYRFFVPEKPGDFEKHDHVVFELSDASTPSAFLVYSDPRRFGFMDLIDDHQNCNFLKNLGPEPLSNHLTSNLLRKRFASRRGPVKTVLLDQHVIAGLGNIYVCEALFRAGINPATPAKNLSASPDGATGEKLEALTRSIRAVLNEALQAGGSTLKDYRQVEGQSGYFQHRFAVYDREGEPCHNPHCNGQIERVLHSGRSTFYCPACQT